MITGELPSKQQKEFQQNTMQHNSMWQTSIRTIVHEGSCPPVRVRVWIRVRFRVGGQCSSGAIVLDAVNFCRNFIFVRGVTLLVSVA